MKNRTACIELKPESLVYIRVACLEAAKQNEPTDRKRNAPIVTGVKGIFTDKRRKVVFTLYSSPGAMRPKRYQKKQRHG